MEKRLEGPLQRVERVENGVFRGHERGLKAACKVVAMFGNSRFRAENGRNRQNRPSEKAPWRLVLLRSENMRIDTRSL